MDGKQERADKFTPGPWAWGGKPGKSELSAAGGNKVLEYAGYEGMWLAAYDDERDAANARLIAAAPDMYAALDLIDELVRECLLGATKLADDDERLARVTAAIDCARAALARAEGRP